MFNNDYYTITNPLNNTEQEERLFDFSSFYRAYVISTEDEKGLGRVRVRIPALHGIRNDEGIAFLKDNELPWAYPGIFAGAGNQTGQVIIPEVGSLVWVTFEYGTDSSRNLIYFGGILTNLHETIEKYIKPDRNVNYGMPYTSKTNDLPTELKTGSKSIVYKSIKGSVIMVDDEDGNESITLIDAAGQKITMTNSGKAIDFLERREGDRTPASTAYINIEHNDKDFIKISEGQIDINANKVLINGSEPETGVSNSYNKLYDRPSINNIVLEGNRDLAEVPLSNIEIENLLN